MAGAHRRSAPSGNSLTSPRVSGSGSVAWKSLDVHSGQLATDGVEHLLVERRVVEPADRYAPGRSDELLPGVGIIEEQRLGSRQGGVRVEDRAVGRNGNCPGAVVLRCIDRLPGTMGPEQCNRFDALAKGLRVHLMGKLDRRTRVCDARAKAAATPLADQQRWKRLARSGRELQRHVRRAQMRGVVLPKHVGLVCPQASDTVARSREVVEQPLRGLRGRTWALSRRKVGVIGHPVWRASKVAPLSNMVSSASFPRSFAALTPHTSRCRRAHHLTDPALLARRTRSSHH